MSSQRSQQANESKFNPIAEHLVDNVCAVCQTTPLKSLTYAQLSGCRHVFHVKCVVQWSEQTCPVCKAPYEACTLPDGSSHPSVPRFWEISGRGNARPVTGTTPTRELEDLSAMDLEAKNEDGEEHTDPPRQESPVNSSSSSSSTSSSRRRGTTTTAPIVDLDRAATAREMVRMLSDAIGCLNSFEESLVDPSSLGEIAATKTLTSEKTANTLESKNVAAFGILRSKIYTVRNGISGLINACHEISASNNALTIFAETAGQREQAMDELRQLEDEERANRERRRRLQAILGKRPRTAN